MERGCRGIAVRPRVVWVATAIVLGAMALGLTGLKASGLTNAQSFRGHPDSVTGQSVPGVQARDVGAASSARWYPLICRVR